MQVILGIDPGFQTTGVAVICQQDTMLRYQYANVISTDASASSSKRLQTIYQQINDVLHCYQPNVAGIESLFFVKNISSAIPVAMAMGVIILALEQKGIPIYKYGPTEIKKTVVGVARGDKNQVMHMVHFLLGIQETVSNKHMTDALAVAITHAHSGGNISHAI